MDHLLFGASRSRRDPALPIQWAGPGLQDRARCAARANAVSFAGPSRAVKWCRIARSAGTALSAWDAARWVLGDRHEPTAMRLPLEDGACLKCHAADVRGTRSTEETDRFHELADHRKLRTPCVACHVTHRTGKPDRNF